MCVLDGKERIYEREKESASAFERSSPADHRKKHYSMAELRPGTVNQLAR